MTDLFSSLTLGPVTGFVPPGAPVNGVVPSEGQPDDTTPDGPPAAATDPQCEVCGRDIPWSGRGRRPKRCQDHKARTKETVGANVDSGAGTARTPRNKAAGDRHQARLDAIVGDLQQGLGELAGTIVPIAPVTAGTIVLQGPQATEALVRIAADHPRMLDGLEIAAKSVPFLAVGKFIAALVLAVAVDMGRLSPDGIAAEYLRVAEAAEAVGWQPPEAAQEQAAQMDRSVPPGPRFHMP